MARHEKEGLKAGKSRWAFLKRKLVLVPLVLILILAAAAPVLASTIIENNNVATFGNKYGFTNRGGYVEVEPSGCGERKGMVEVRFSMYLNPGDYGYNVHHILVPDFAGQVYKGELDRDSSPVDSVDYEKWVDSLPKVWQNNPFHNHFIQVEPGTSDEIIMDIGEAFLEEAYTKWSKDEPLDLKNAPVTWVLDADVARKGAIAAKVEHLKTTQLVRENKKFKW